MGKELKHFYEFGPFRIDPEERQLMRGSETIPLTPKAFDTLLILISRSERVVLKDDLMKALWPDSYVEESNLTQNIFVLRKALGETAQDARYIATVPGRGYRFTEKVRTVPESEEQGLVIESRSLTHVVIEEQDTGLRWWWIGLAAAVVLCTGIGLGLYWRAHTQSGRAAQFAEKDSVVIADFANTTGEGVFDDTLKQALAIQLEQSPFLRVLPDSKVRSTLKLMNHPVTEHVTEDVAREICLRNNGKAMLQGSIGDVGGHYLVGLRAVECQSGETLASASQEVRGRDGILTALGTVGNQLRNRLGESLASVEKFNKPLEQATTCSLDALKAYTLGQQALARGDERAGAEAFTRAVSLDPEFARAYAALGSVYHNLRQPSRSIENYKKAYGLRERVSDRERFYIEANYYSHVTGQADKSIETYKEWIEYYPQDLVPHFNLASRYGALGQYEKALAENQLALKIAPDDAGGYGTLMGLYLPLERWQEAKRAFEQAEARKLDNFVLRENRYDLAFIENDTAGMREQVTQAMGRADEEDLMLSAQSDTEAYYGRLSRAHDLTERAMQTALRNDAKETAAFWEAESAVRDAEAGEPALARREADAAMALGPGYTVRLASGLALSRSGDDAGAQKIIDGLDKEYPQSTLVQGYYLPSMRAALQIAHNDPAAAIHTLEPAEPYELGANRTLYPAYLRGIAYLMTKDGEAASTEFLKLIHHRGVVSNFIFGSLAHLELARARALTGDKDAARKSYQDFLELWKDADPDVPVLRQAKAEYAKLQ